MKHLSAAYATIMLFSACEISSEDTVAPNPPTVSISDINQAFDRAEDASTLPFTALINLPTGSAIYDGQIGADLSGDSLGSLLGDLTMQVDFAGNSIAGNVRNINLINQDGGPDQRLGGDLEIAGFETNGDIDAGAGGQLSAVSVDGEILSSDVNLDLEGAVRTGVVSGDAIYGVVTGDARGDFNLDIDGRFYGDRR